MNGLYSLLIAVSMYSKFPVPTVNWTRERMGYVMCWFPVVGVIEGLALWFWQWAGGRLGFTDAGNALVAAALPLIVTGGIHMDGFLDTMDAIHSYGDREKKLEILKDPHVGAFAVIGCGGYLLLYAAAAYEVTVLGLWPLALPVFVMERAFSGLSVVFFPCAKKERPGRNLLGWRQAPGGGNQPEPLAGRGPVPWRRGDSGRKPGCGVRSFGSAAIGIRLLPPVVGRAVRRHHRGSGRVFSAGLRAGGVVLAGGGRTHGLAG